LVEKDRLNDALKQLKEEEESISSMKHEYDTLLSQHNELISMHKKLTSECDDLHAQLQRRHENQADSETTEEKLQKDVDLLMKEREELIQDRKDIEEDNEDLLIQLALVKEQLEIGESQLADRETNLNFARKELARLQDANEKLCTEQNASKERGAEIEYLKKAMQDLSSQKQAMEEELRLLGSRNNAQDDEILKLISQNEELSEELEDAQSQTAVAASNRQDYENRQLQKVKDLEREALKLDGICQSQHNEIQKLSSMLSNADGAFQRSNDESRLLRQQISHLEQNREDLLKRKDAAIDDLHAQLDRLRSEGVQSDQQLVSEMSIHIEELQNQLRHSEQQSRDEFGRLQELEQMYQSCRKELDDTSHRLKAAENALRENDMQAREALKHQHQEANTTVHQQEQTIQQLRQETQELVNRIAQLERKLKADGMKLGEMTELVTMTKQEAAEKEQQLQEFQRQVSDLSARLSYVEEVRQRDQSTASSEIEMLKNSNSKKNGSIKNLENQLKELSFELVEQSKKLTRKEDELGRLALDLEEARSEQLETTQRVAAKVLDSEVSWTEAESTDHMRGLIISLSQALENSESQRAEAIDRLLKERKANADSLKRLGESVKRFYSTLTISSP